MPCASVSLSARICLPGTGKVEALKAAREKVEYLVEALGKRLGGVVCIVEEGYEAGVPFARAMCWPRKSLRLTASGLSGAPIPCLSDSS